MTSERLVLIDEPAKGVRRITLNRPEKRNAMNNALRGDLLSALREADGDDSVHVSIVRGAGACFSSGYDLGSDLGKDQPYFTPKVGMPWARHVSEGWMSIWDLAKPVIAQVHGYAMAGGLGRDLHPLALHAHHPHARGQARAQVGAGHLETNVRAREHHRLGAARELRPCGGCADERGAGEQGDTDESRGSGHGRLLQAAR